MKLLTLASLVVSLIILNILFRMGIERVKMHNKVLDYVKRFLPVFELVGWSLFTLWLLDILFASANYKTPLQLALLLLIVIFISWFLLRDIVAGVAIKARFNLNKGQNLRYEDLTGEIRKTGLLALCIRDENGIDVFLPYHSIDQKAIRLNYRENGEVETKFVIDLDPDINEDETISKMEELIINSAWCSVKFKPKVQCTGVHNNKKQFQVICQPSTSDGISKLKSMLGQSLGK